MTQLVARVEEALVASVDELVAEGFVASRSEAVRQGLQILIDQVRRQRTAEAIIAGYRPQLQTELEVGLGRRGDGSDDQRELVTPTQGDIWWAEAEDKRRPVLVVTRSEAIPVLTWIMVAPVTRTIQESPPRFPSTPSMVSRSPV